MEFRGVRRTYVLVGLVGLSLHAWAVPDLTFLHLSDIHYPYAAAQTREVLAALPTNSPLTLAPYGVTVPPPSFAIITGDLNEFGGGSGWWEGYLGLWRDIPLPVYHQLGNHDNTWDCGRPRLRRLHGSAFYAFEHSEVKFIGWDSATPQDPRPSVATEGLAWLRAEFDRTPVEQPVVFFCHHPPDGREFAGAYDRSRLLDVLQTRNVILLLVGHGHGVRAWKIDGLDTVMGGSTYGDRRGYGIVSIQGDVLRVCHQHIAPQPRMVGLLEKPVPKRCPVPQLRSISPPDGAVFSPDQPIQLSVNVDDPENVQTAAWLLDGQKRGELLREGDNWKATLNPHGLQPGAHILRLEIAAADGQQASRTVAFWLDDGPLRIAWKHQLAGSCQSTPTVSRGRIYVGANDGALYALNAATGAQVWRFVTAGEVRSKPAVDEATRKVCSASADGCVYMLALDGGLHWRSETGNPIYASPLLIENKVLCATNAGEVLALSAETGALVWRSQEPDYAIESAPCAGNGAVYAGAWDRFVYALDIQTGTLRWRKPCRGSNREGEVARYFSPADCSPALAEDDLFVTDRAYYLTILDARSGEQRLTEEHCVAVAGSYDGRSVYIRHTDGRVSKRRADGSVIWVAELPTGYIAAPPAEAAGRVLVLSDRGTLSVLDAETGRALTQYKAFPDTFAFAAPAYDGERIYVVDMTGTLLALSMPQP